MPIGEQWRPHLEEVLAIVTPRVTERRSARLYGWLDAGEYGHCLDLLVRILLRDRVPLTDRAHDLLTSVLEAMGPAADGGLPYLSDPAALPPLFDRVNRPLHTRGTPALRGEPALPPGRTARQVAEVVLAHSPTPLVRLLNNRYWRAGSVDGVPVGVLSTPLG